MSQLLPHKVYLKVSSVLTSFDFNQSSNLSFSATVNQFFQSPTSPVTECLGKEHV